MQVSKQTDSTLSLFAAPGTEGFFYFPPEITKKMLACLVHVYHHSSSEIYRRSADSQRKVGELISKAQDVYES